MAKIYGLNGIIRGRQGNNVYSVQNGTQVLKVYQPVVANPRSNGQRVQRAKFSLAGKISSVTPSSALVGLRGSSNRDKRAEFVRLITRSATTSGLSNDITAAVPFSSLIFSQGSLPVYSDITSVTAEFTGTDARTNVRVQIPASSWANLAPEGYRERIVVALFDGNTSYLDEMQVLDRPQSTALTVLFRLSQRRSITVCVYQIPMAPSISLGSPSSQSIAPATSDVTLEVTSASSISEYDFGMSNFVGAYPILYTPSRDDEREGGVQSEVVEGGEVSKKKK